MNWMIYGANGYTGELAARHAVEVGERPILAGRSAAVAELAAELGLEHRIFGLDAIDLTGVDAVLHCAGPFSRTSTPMVDACLAAGAHYLDLTGEWDVMEAIYARHDEAVAAGVALIPAVGYDVVPTDYLVVKLHRELPTATRADVALVSRGGLSRGTIRTAVEGMRESGRIRSGGELKTVEPAHRSLKIRVGDRHATVSAIPLGDISSSYRATGIENITDFTPLPPGATGLPAALARKILSVGVVYRMVDGLLARTLTGPSDASREQSQSDAWAQLGDDDGNTVTAAIRVPNTYDFTVRSAVHAVRAARTKVEPGAWAPSQALGVDFLATIPDLDVKDLAV